MLRFLEMKPPIEQSEILLKPFQNVIISVEILCPDMMKHNSAKNQVAAILICDNMAINVHQSSDFSSYLGPSLQTPIGQEVDVGPTHKNIRRVP